jgi:hypothetical protein
MAALKLQIEEMRKEIIGLSLQNKSSGSVGMQKMFVNVTWHFHVYMKVADEY